jgi:hypothetical protein
MKQISILLLALPAVFAVVTCAGEKEQRDTAEQEGEAKMAFTLTSTAFSEGEMIPKKYTCDDADISPPLAWAGAPEGTRSFALISDDPDAPGGTWVHWVMYNLPPATLELPEHLPASDTLSSGARQGISDFDRFGYGGPCPPSGTHRYFFKLYALDTALKLQGRVTKADLEKAMDGHVLAETQLMGKYSRER